VTESKDYSATVLDGEGNLVTGGGRIEYHFGAAMNAVRSTIARHGVTIRPGDVFLANDPHNGGGLHAQDVMVQQPVFVDDDLVAWVVNSAHLMDMGGMVMGFISPGMRSERVTYCPGKNRGKGRPSSGSKYTLAVSAVSRTSRATRKVRQPSQELSPAAGFFGSLSSASNFCRLSRKSDSSRHCRRSIPTIAATSIVATSSARARPR